MTGVPTGVKNDNPIGGNKVDAQPSRAGGNEEQAHSQAGRLVEVLAVNLSSFRGGTTIESRTNKIIIHQWAL